jgi:hypothetical protein
MDAAAQQWFLRKHDGGGVFGPLRFDQLSRWAMAAQVAPHDTVSSDQENWIKAPMLAELGMDWLVEVTSERFYGPTTLGTVAEFLRLGEITGDVFVINTCTNARLRVSELNLSAPGIDLEKAVVSGEPDATGMSIDADERVRDLEQALREERQALDDTEQRYRELEERYRELLEQTAVDGLLR